MDVCNIYTGFLKKSEGGYNFLSFIFFVKIRGSTFGGCPRWTAAKD